MIRLESYQVMPDSPQMQRDTLYIVASLLAHSEDPLAVETVRIARINSIVPVAVDGFQEYPGRGWGGLVTLPNESGPRAVLIGTHEFLKQCNLQTPALLDATLQKWTKDGSRVVLVGWDGHVRSILKFGQLQ